MSNYIPQVHKLVGDKRFNDADKARETSNTCLVCNLTFKNYQHFTIHCSGLLHAERLNALNASATTGLMSESQRVPYTGTASYDSARNNGSGDVSYRSDSLAADQSASSRRRELERPSLSDKLQDSDWLKTQLQEGSASTRGERGGSGARYEGGSGGRNEGVSSERYEGGSGARYEGGSGARYGEGSRDRYDSGFKDLPGSSGVSLSKPRDIYDGYQSQDRDARVYGRDEQRSSSYQSTGMSKPHGASMSQAREDMDELWNKYSELTERKSGLKADYNHTSTTDYPTAQYPNAEVNPVGIQKRPSEYGYEDRGRASATQWSDDQSVGGKQETDTFAAKMWNKMESTTAGMKPSSKAVLKEKLMKLIDGLDDTGPTGDLAAALLLERLAGRSEPSARDSASTSSIGKVPGRGEVADYDARGAGSAAYGFAGAQNASGSTFVSAQDPVQGKYWQDEQSLSRLGQKPADVGRTLFPCFTGDQSDYNSAPVQHAAPPSDSQSWRNDTIAAPVVRKEIPEADTRSNVRNPSLEKSVKPLLDNYEKLCSRFLSTMHAEREERVEESQVGGAGSGGRNRLNLVGQNRDVPERAADKEWARPDRMNLAPDDFSRRVETRSENYSKSGGGTVLGSAVKSDTETLMDRFRTFLESSGLKQGVVGDGNRSDFGKGPDAGRIAEPVVVQNVSGFNNELYCDRERERGELFQASHGRVEDSLKGNWLEAKQGLDTAGRSSTRVPDRSQVGQVEGEKGRLTDYPQSQGQSRQQGVSSSWQGSENEKGPGSGPKALFDFSAVDKTRSDNRYPRSATLPTSEISPAEIPSRIEVVTGRNRQKVEPPMKGLQQRTDNGPDLTPANRPVDNASNEPAFITNAGRWNNSGSTTTRPHEPSPYGGTRPPIGGDTAPGVPVSRGLPSLLGDAPTSEQGSRGQAAGRGKMSLLGDGPASIRSEARAQGTNSSSADYKNYTQRDFPDVSRAPLLSLSESRPPHDHKRSVGGGPSEKGSLLGDSPSTSCAQESSGLSRSDSGAQPKYSSGRTIPSLLGDKPLQNKSDASSVTSRQYPDSKRYADQGGLRVPSPNMSHNQRPAIKPLIDAPAGRLETGKPLLDTPSNWLKKVKPLLDERAGRREEAHKSRPGDNPVRREADESSKKMEESLRRHLDDPEIKSLLDRGVRSLMDLPLGDQSRRGSGDAVIPGYKSLMDHLVDFSEKLETRLSDGRDDSVPRFGLLGGVPRRHEEPPPKRSMPLPSPSAFIQEHRKEFLPHNRKLLDSKGFISSNGARW